MAKKGAPVGNNNAKGSSAGKGAGVMRMENHITALGKGQTGKLLTYGIGGAALGVVAGRMINNSSEAGIPGGLIGAAAGLAGAVVSKARAVNKSNPVTPQDMKDFNKYYAKKR